MYKRYNSYEIPTNANYPYQRQIASLFVRKIRVIASQDRLFDRFLRQLINGEQCFVVFRAEERGPPRARQKDDKIISASQKSQPVIACNW